MEARIQTSPALYRACGAIILRAVHATMGLPDSFSGKRCGWASQWNCLLNYLAELLVCIEEGCFPKGGAPVYSGL